MKKKVLVTGGTGFIGQHLVNRLVSLNHQVSIIDDLSASKKNNLSKKVKFIKFKIQDPKLNNLIKSIKPEVIFHLAAENSVSSLASKTLTSNVIGTYNLLNAAKNNQVKHFIFTSSAAVYGDSKTFPITETHPTKPISSYGISKLTSELHLKLFQDHFKTTIFRFANVYGPGQNSSSEGGVVAIFIKQLLSNQKPFIYGDGHQTRDFVYVSDVVDALVKSLDKPTNTTLNIGSNTKISILDLLKTIAKLLDKPVNIINKPKRPIEIERSLFDFKLAKKILNWQPKISLVQGLTEIINSLK
ncbi:MAG: NAD-dependent epimerase/dehydratase family protein [Candidatus Beckwithbacteria bacterium]|nr:GDP-mannose 4,6-dehydratase [Patescibacteria group bacterium]